MNSLCDAGKVWLSPCKPSSTCYDDRFILELAKKYDAAVISNDNYRDLLDEDSSEYIASFLVPQNFLTLLFFSRKFTEWNEIINERVVGFMSCDDSIVLPDDPYGKFGRCLGVILHKRKPIIPAVETVIQLDD